jgi:hypothetical protein
MRLSSNPILILVLFGPIHTAEPARYSKGQMAPLALNRAPQVLIAHLPYMLWPQGLHSGSRQHSVPGPHGLPVLWRSSHSQVCGDEDTREVSGDRTGLV